MDENVAVRKRWQLRVQVVCVAHVHNAHHEGSGGRVIHGEQRKNTTTIHQQPCTHSPKQRSNASPTSSHTIRVSSLPGSGAQKLERLSTQRQRLLLIGHRKEADLVLRHGKHIHQQIAMLRALRTKTNKKQTTQTHLWRQGGKGGLHNSLRGYGMELLLLLLLLQLLLLEPLHVALLSVEKLTLLRRGHQLRGHPEKNLRLQHCIRKLRV